MIEAIRIKTFTRELREGRPCIVRKRGVAVAPVIHLANRFFGWAGNPVRVCSSRAEWQKWEVDSFKLLNGEEWLAFAEGTSTVVTEILPGKSLARHLEEGSFREEMLDSAAAELRRAHQIDCPELGGSWSHGDANLANFLFDPVSGRSRIIDFEIVPQSGMAATERQAGDLLVFLQDLAGCIARERWVPAALRFLEAYGEPERIACLRAKLVLPGGIPRLWWWIRSNYIGIAELRSRIEELRAALGERAG